MGTPVSNGAPGNQAATVIAVVVCLLSVATILLAGRIYARCVLVNAPGIDDWAALIAWVTRILIATKQKKKC